MEALKPGDPGVVGGYRLSGRLAQGRLGAVFLGKAKDGCPVAVRLVRPDLATDKKFTERFRKAVAAARKVDGPHLAHVLDADPDGTPPWLVTEFAPGLALDAAVAEHGALPEESLRALGSALARALAAVHAVKVAHQGLAASTVALTADGPQITDLGIPALPGAEATGALPAPEQATGGTVGAPTDVFALAGLLCQAARVAPYGKGTAAELAQKVLRSTPDLDGMPSDLAEIVARCLARRPDARPTAAELVELFDGEDATGTAWLPAPVRAAVAAAVAAGTPEKTAKPAKSTKSTAAAPASDTKKAAPAKPAASNGKASATGAKSAAAASAGKAEEPSDGKSDETAATTPVAAVPVESADAADDEPETVEVQVGAVAAKAAADEDAKDKAESEEGTEDDVEDATPVATPVVPAQSGDKSKPGTSGSPAGGQPATKTAAETAAAKPAAESATPAAPTVVAQKPLDQPQLMKPRTAAPLPSTETDADTGPDTGTDTGAGEPTAKAAAVSSAAPTAVVRTPGPADPAPRADSAPTVLADPKPAVAAAAAATAAPAAPPQAVPDETPRKREASNTVWYALIVLVGLTSVGLAVYRLADSNWRDLQNPFMGLVLPGISLACGLAGILVLALTVIGRRKAAGQQPTTAGTS